MSRRMKIPLDVQKRIIAMAAAGECLEAISRETKIGREPLQTFCRWSMVKVQKDSLAAQGLTDAQVADVKLLVTRASYSRKEALEVVMRERTPVRAVPRGMA